MCLPTERAAPGRNEVVNGRPPPETTTDIETYTTLGSDSPFLSCRGKRITRAPMRLIHRRGNPTHTRCEGLVTRIKTTRKPEQSDRSRDYSRSMRRTIRCARLSCSLLSSDELVCNYWRFAFGVLGEPGSSCDQIFSGDLLLYVVISVSKLGDIGQRGKYAKCETFYCSVKKVGKY